ncbi:MAG TPA: AI-2E family transporter [Rhodanobacteraceae bacterium]|nr:AI-2E family transporter [Rhodanobacteraceae bacterium]
MPPPISLPTPAQVAAHKLSNKSPRPAGRKKRPTSSERRRDRRLRALRLPLTVLMLLAIAGALIFASPLLIPLLLAAFIALGLNPIVAGLARVHVPRMLGSILLMLVVGVGVGATVNALSTPAAEWIHQAPTVMRDVGYRLHRMTRPLTEVSHAASRSLAGMGVVASAPTVQAAPAPTFSFGSLLQAAPRALADALTVVLLVFFFLTYGDQMRARLVTASPRFRYRRIAARVVRGIQAELSRYLLTVTIINCCLGGLTGLILWAWKMPDPLLWGGVATLLNFMPYIGGITTTLLLVVVGLLTFHDPAHALLPAASFAVLAMLEGNVVTPMVMGSRMRLSPVAILIWLLIWAWMWGIPGALLAVPLLTCVKLVAEWTPGWEWFAKMVER